MEQGKSRSSEALSCFGNGGCVFHEGTAASSKETCSIQQRTSPSFPSQVSSECHTLGALKKANCSPQKWRRDSAMAGSLDPSTELHALPSHQQSLCLQQFICLLLLAFAIQLLVSIGLPAACSALAVPGILATPCWFLLLDRFHQSCPDSFLVLSFFISLFALGKMVF